jgi:hypothetical protein
MVTWRSRRRCADSRGGRARASVVKSRAKNADPRFLTRRADLFIERDEDVFPYTSIELVAISDLCVHFQSAGGAGGRARGVPSLSIRCRRRTWRDTRAFRRCSARSRGACSNFPGLVWSMDAAEATRRLATAGLADFAWTGGAAALHRDLPRLRRYAEQRARCSTSSSPAGPRQRGRASSSSSASLKSSAVSMFTDFLPRHHIGSGDPRVEGALRPERGGPDRVDGAVGPEARGRSWRRSTLPPSGKSHASRRSVTVSIQYGG